MMNTILLPPPSTSNIFRVHPSSTSIKQQLATFEALHRSFVARLLRVFSRLFVLSCLLSFRWVSFCWFVVHQDLLHSFNWWSLVARECSRMSVVVAKNSCLETTKKKLNLELLMIFLILSLSFLIQANNH